MYKWERREQKQKSKRSKMPKHGASVKLWVDLQRKKADELRKAEELRKEESK